MRFSLKQKFSTRPGRTDAAVLNRQRTALAWVLMCAMILLNGWLHTKGLSDSIYSVFACVGVLLAAHHVLFLPPEPEERPTARARRRQR